MTQLTPKQVAKAIGVSDASLKRWCDKGLLPSVRTAGGHRRIPLSGVIDFLRENNQAPVRPEILGLPATCGTGQTVSNRATTQIREALESGDEECFHRIAFDLYLAGQPIAAILDDVIAPAFHALGLRWQHGQVEVYQERRGCEIALRFLHRMLPLMPHPEEGAPYAIGGTLATDAYTLPTTMVELTLREAGWRAESFGSGLPAETVCAALRECRPRLLWLSVSHFADLDGFLESYEHVYATAAQLGVAIVAGGYALTEEVRRQLRYVTYCDKLQHLVAFARSLVPPKRNDVATAST